MPLDHGDLDEIAGEIGALVAIDHGNIEMQMFGDDLAGQDADHIGFVSVRRRNDGTDLRGPV